MNVDKTLLIFLKQIKFQATFLLSVLIILSFRLKKSFFKMFFIHFYFQFANPLKRIFIGCTQYFIFLSKIFFKTLFTYFNQQFANPLKRILRVLLNKLESLIYYFVAFHPNIKKIIMVINYINTNIELSNVQINSLSH